MLIRTEKSISDTNGKGMRKGLNDNIQHKEGESHSITSSLSSSRNRRTQHKDSSAYDTFLSDCKRDLVAATAAADQLFHPTVVVQLDRSVF